MPKKPKNKTFSKETQKDIMTLLLDVYVNNTVENKRIEEIFESMIEEVDEDDSKKKKGKVAKAKKAPAKKILFQVSVDEMKKINTNWNTDAQS